MIKYLIWDFNGTIVNDVDICVDLINNLLKKKGKPPLSKQQYQNVFTFPVIEYYKKAGLIDNDEEFKEVAHEWMNSYYALEHQVSPFANVNSIMQRVQELGIKQGIISASAQDQLERMLEATNLKPYLSDVLGINDIYATSKVHIGQAFIERCPYQPNEILMVGDTLHDKEVALAMGINYVLCAQGHQSYEVLSVNNNHVIKDLAEIFEYLK